MIKIILGFFFMANIVFAETSVLSEEQIPLKIEQHEKVTDTTSNTTKMILSFVVVSFMLGAAYYFIRKYNVTSQLGSQSNMQIKVLAQHFLGPKKSLAIIRVAGESVLIGVTENNISMIKTLSLLDEELPHIFPKNFEEALTEKSDAAAEVETAEDDFSFAGLKTTVSQKLKSMRSLQ